jgi:hypothetical protein
MLYSTPAKQGESPPPPVADTTVDYWRASHHFSGSYIGSSVSIVVRNSKFF